MSLHCLDNRVKADTLLLWFITQRKRIYAMSREAGQDEQVLLCRITPADIDLFNKLLEGYDNLALVTTVDAALGRMSLRFAASARRDLLALLRHLPIPVLLEEAGD